MSEENQVIELNQPESRQLEVLGAGLPVTTDDLISVRERISILKKFVATQMRTDVDYGIIPGTNKNTLYQAGAQKLARLFGLTIKKKRTYQRIDKENNFAMFTYQASVYHARTGELLAQCEGSCNSQEKKYAARKNYKTNALEVTPIYDVLNTLQKMAQKRAFVGAVIEACGAADFYTQDIDDPDDAKALGINPRNVTTAQTNIPKTTSTNSSDQTTKPRCPKCGADGRNSNDGDGYFCSKYSKGCKTTWGKSAKA